MKKLIRVLLVVLLVLALAVAGAVGFLWYRNTHIFVEDAVYAKDATELDLREEDISIEHYESVRAQLPGCEIVWNVPFQGGKVDSESVSVAVKTLAEEDIAILQKYVPKLKKVDATGCHDYVVLESLKAQMPNLEVVYQVSIGGTSYAPDVTELVLQKGDYDILTLTENLKYLPNVASVTLRIPEETQEQIDALRAAYEAVTVTCTVEIFRQEYDVQTTELDLSNLTSADVEEVSGKLAQLPNLSHVNLNPEGAASALTVEDVKVLLAAAPDVVFDYKFDFFGHTLSTADEEVHIKNTAIGNDALDQVRAALDILANCKRFVLENCQISNENMAQLRDDYRDKTKVVWRVQFGRGTTMTDAQIIRAVYDLSNTNCHNLKYCEDARFIDFGHNGDDGNYLRDISYIANMPNLEAIILSSAYITDLTPFANCTKLKCLEIAFCGLVTDISPLAGCTSLEMLNISFTGVKDLSPLDNLPIKYLCAMNYSANRVSQEEQDRFQQLHPDCWSQYVGEQPYGPGWRYTEDGKDYLPYYQLLRDVFQYEIYPRTPNHVGWYLGETEYASIATYEATVAAAAAAVEETPAEETVEETVAETVEATVPEETTE